MDETPKSIIRNRSIQRVLLLIAVITSQSVLPACVTRDEHSAAQPTEEISLISKLDVIGEAALRDHDYPGLSIVVMKGGEILAARGYGYADLENEISATPETIYPIASLSKHFTAAAIMKLNEQGRVDLNDPVTDYVPAFKDQSPVTRIHHLLRQCSGVPESTEEIEAGA
jgi:CubicO group peptidase (beta-lactamase class C family)